MGYDVRVWEASADAPGGYQHFFQGAHVSAFAHIHTHVCMHDDKQIHVHTHVHTQNGSCSPSPPFPHPAYMLCCAPLCQINFEIWPLSESPYDNLEYVSPTGPIIDGGPLGVVGRSA